MIAACVFGFLIVGVFALLLAACWLGYECLNEKEDAEGE